MSRRTSCCGAVPTGALALVGALGFASSAQADHVTIDPTLPAPRAMTAVPMEPLPTPDSFRAHYETRGPNLVMIGEGVITFGISYGIAAIVRATSSHRGDGHLLVPVVGPWLDFADRGGCGVTGSTSCDLERRDKIGLVIDGIFQGVGVLAVVGGFVFRGKREAMATDGVAARKLQFVPVQYAHGGMGLAAVGSF